MAVSRFAQIATANGPFVLGTRAVPRPGPGEVLVRVHACGVCHSDAFVQAAAFPGLVLPRVPGHEVAGVVAGLGAGVRGWREGDRVGVERMHSGKARFRAVLTMTEGAS